jgi:hypothetical protein
MAGRPIRRNMLQVFKNAGGDEWLLEQVAAGRTLTAIGKELGISAAKVCGYLREPARREAYARAQESAAAALVDQSLEIVDDADPQTVQLAKLRSETRRWIAGKLHREQWGEQSGPQVAIQINGLHAGMLRNRDWEE